MHFHIGHNTAVGRILCYLLFTLGAVFIALAMREGIISVSRCLTPGFFIGF